ncbi:hypothetical protein KBY88_02330 [Cyanobium sp. Morenito 9A2]|nr:hypothetical protein [Cyanobium sp. Morenito 9A2]
MTTPSFEIRGAVGLPLPSLRFDRVDSGRLISMARRLYLQHFEHGPCGGEPLGIVLNLQSAQGRVVFEPPVLLPEEQFVALDYIRGASTRPRHSRSPARR